MLEQHPEVYHYRSSRPGGGGFRGRSIVLASKAQIVRGLISFLEETVLGRVPAIKRAPSRRAGALRGAAHRAACLSAGGTGGTAYSQGRAGRKRSAFRRDGPDSLSASKRLRQLFGTGSSPKAVLPGSLRPSAPTLCWPPPKGAAAPVVRGGFEPTPLEHFGLTSGNPGRGLFCAAPT